MCIRHADAEERVLALLHLDRTLVAKTRSDRCGDITTQAPKGLYTS